MAPRKAKSKQEVSTATTQEKHKNLIPWKPGQSGNPSGRPKGSRDKINEAFIAALCEDFQEYGAAVIQTVRSEKPDVYLRVVAGLQPKEIDVRDRTLEDLTDEEVFDALAAIKSLKSQISRTSRETAGKDRRQASGKEASRRQLN